MKNLLSIQQKELVARSLANLDELKVFSKYINDGDALQIIAEGKHFNNSLNIATKCLEYLYTLEKESPTAKI